MSTASPRDEPPTTIEAVAAPGDRVPTPTGAQRTEIPRMTHDHETVIVEKGDGGGGTNMGVVLGIIGIVVLLIAVWYFALGPGGGSKNTTNTNNNTVNPPAASQPAASQPAAS